MTRPHCPKCDGLLRHDPADVIGPERVTCTICGWVMLREKPGEVEKQEETPAPSVPAVKTDSAPRPKGKNPRGTCPACKREDVLLTSIKGDCHRCYKRVASGHDPLSATRPMPLAKAPAATKVPSVPSAPSVPCDLRASSLVFVFQGDNLAILKRFERLSRQSGGNPEDDLCTIIDLYLDGQLQLREALHAH